MNTNQENQEIGELLDEITRKGFGAMLTDVNDAGPSRMVEIDVAPHSWESGYLPSDGISVEASSIVEALHLIVDEIRRRRGEPLLAEEVANIVESERLHLKAEAKADTKEELCRLLREIATNIEEGVTGSAGGGLHHWSKFSIEPNRQLIVEPELAVWGLNAACSCGSVKGLISDRIQKVTFDWNGSRGWFHYPQQFNPCQQPGEIGRCPDCGKQYRLRA